MRDGQYDVCVCVLYLFIFYDSEHHKPHFRLIPLAGPISFRRYIFFFLIFFLVPSVHMPFLQGFVFAGLLSSHLLFVCGWSICCAYAAVMVVLKHSQFQQSTVALNTMCSHKYSVAFQTTFSIQFLFDWFAFWILIDINIVWGDLFFFFLSLLSFFLLFIKLFFVATAKLSRAFSIFIHHLM